MRKHVESEVSPNNRKLSSTITLHNQREDAIIALAIMIIFVQPGTENSATDISV